jgi:hypothetical protein
MSTRQIGGWVLVIGGGILLLLSALADVLGLGRDPHFGPWQVTGVVVSVLALAAGVLFLRRRQS